jgi:flagellar protein FliO/FliZ
MIEGLGTLVRLVLSLATVLILMVFLARYLRNRQIGVGSGLGATQRRRKALLLEVVTRQGLSRGSSLAVVRVSGQLLLLGVTESAVSVLRELEDVEEPEPLPQTQAIAISPQSLLGIAIPPHGRLGIAIPSQGRLGIATAQSVVETLRQWTARHG